MERKRGSSKIGIIIGIIVILIAIIVTVLITLVIPDLNKKKNKENNITEESNEDEKLSFEYTEYENKDKQIYFKYPKEFTSTSEKEENGHFLFLASNPVTGESINVVIAEIKAELTLDKYIDASLDSMIKSGLIKDKNDVKVDKSDIKLGVKEAFENEYITNGVNIYQRTAINNKKEYVITYSGKDGDFDKSKGKEIFDTFRFTDDDSKREENALKDGFVISTKQKPADIGEWIIASKYNSDNNKYQDVKIKVTSIKRGEEAKKIVKDFADSKSDYLYSDPKDGMEWVVIEYDLDFYKFEKSEKGANTEITTSIKGTGNNTAVKYNEMSYIINTTKIGSSEYIKDSKGSNRIAATLPIGCSDYVIEFGTYNQTLGYVKGK